MAFMQLFVEQGLWLVIDTSNGTFVVPADIPPVDVSELPIGETTEDADILDAVSEYVEGEPYDVTLKEGYCARYSAPGYLDCTDWCGPYDTSEQAETECREVYGDEDEESEETDTDD